MTNNTQTRIAMLLCAVMLLVPALTLAQTPQAANSLRIVVIAGEDAINIIQQKTAVNPIVEVRDRNDLPVSGVLVTFNVGGQGASFAGGASTLSLTTNAAGQAVVTGLTPTATGAVTINASAVVNGQTIAATITQTNFATAAEAAAAGSAGSAGGGAGGAAGGAGGGIGGLSGTTLGIVGGGIAAAGALIATTAGGGSDSPAVSTGGSGNTGTGTATTPTTPAPTTPAPTTPTTQTFNGPVSQPVNFTWTTSGAGESYSCNATYTKTATMRIVLTTQTGGTVTGTAQMLSIATSITSIRCSDGTDLPLPGTSTGEAADSALIPITGTTGNLRFQEDFNFTDSSVSIRGSSVFTGSLSGGAITGTLAETFALTSDGDGVSTRGNWSGSASVTLR